MNGSFMAIAGREFRVQGAWLRIASAAADRFVSMDDPEASCLALRGAAMRIDVFTFMQTLPDTAPQHTYAMEWDNVAALPVSTFDHWWTTQINAKTRNLVRTSAKKRLVVHEVPFDDTLVRGISAIYNESPVRQGKPFWHYGKDLETVRRENATFLDRSIFIGAFCGENLIGFAKLVCDRDRRQAGLMQIISMLRHRDTSATNALIAQAVRSCAERQIAYLVYARFTYGRKARDGLSDFKRHNGFRRIDVPRYYVPLTPIGRAALRLGLHHPFVDRIPEPLLAVFRRARSRRYGAPPPRGQRMNAS